MSLEVKLGIIKISDIKVGERWRKNYGDLTDLKNSISERGLIQPIAVQVHNDSYLLLAGGRRLQSCAELSMEFVPVRMYIGDLGEPERRAIEYAENIYRADLTWQEEINLRSEIHDLMTTEKGKASSSPGSTKYTGSQAGWSINDSAKMIGESYPTLASKLRLAKAMKEIPELKDCKSEAEAVKRLSQLEEKVVKDELAQRVQVRLARTPLLTRKDKLSKSYLIGNVLKTLPELFENSFGIVEIDPPYAIDLQTKKRKSLNEVDTDLEEYNEIPVEEYEEFMYQLLTECYRVMTPNSWLILWFGIAPWYEPIRQLCIKCNFQGNFIPAIWDKGTGQTNTPERYLSNNYEVFFYCRKGDPTMAKQGRSNIFKFPPVHPSRKTHPTERPVELMQAILETFNYGGNRILVPFGGSGNTLKAAYNLGIEGVCYDLVPTFRNSFIKDVEELKGEKFKSYRE